MVEIRVSKQAPQPFFFWRFPPLALDSKVGRPTTNRPPPPPPQHASRCRPLENVAQAPPAPAPAMYHNHPSYSLDDLPPPPSLPSTPSLNPRCPPVSLPRRALKPLAEEPAGEAALAAGEGGARAFRLLVERASEWVGAPAEGVRAVTWELLFGLRHDVSVCG